MKRSSGLLLCCVCTLLALGTVMIFSVISAHATTVGVAVKYLLKHVLWVAIAVAAMVAMSRLDYRRLQRQWWLVGAVGLILLIAVLVPGIGTLKNGARRWIRLGPVGFQPSESAKLAMLVALCAVIVWRGEGIRDISRGLLPCLALVGGAASLILAEPDFGTAFLVGMVGIIVVVAAGARVMPIVGAALVGLGGLTLLLLKSPARLERVFAFLEPAAHQNAAGYQAYHSLVALGSGGLPGRVGMQKLFYLPAADSDFVLAIIGEELGLIGTLAVVVAFALIVRQGMQISRDAPDAFAGLLAFGITVMIASQALIHIAVVTASMPTKGITLPFVSSGGSSLVVSMAGIGILLNIASRRQAEETTRSKRERRMGEPGRFAFWRRIWGGASQGGKADA